MSHWSAALPTTACRVAVRWAATQPDYETAWATCKRADWMLWLIGRMEDSVPVSAERRQIVRCALEIVQTVRHLMPPAGVSCVDLVARWCDGADVSRDKILAAAHAAAYAADAAAYDSDAAYAAHAAANAAHAANAAYAAAYAADAAAYAAYAANAAHTAAHAAAYAAYDSDAAYAAAIVRRHYPTPPVLR